MLTFICNNNRKSVSSHELTITTAGWPFCGQTLWDSKSLQPSWWPPHSFGKHLSPSNSECSQHAQMCTYPREHVHIHVLHMFTWICEHVHPRGYASVDCNRTHWKQWCSSHYVRTTCLHRFTLSVNGHLGLNITFNTIWVILRLWGYKLSQIYIFDEVYNTFAIKSPSMSVKIVFMSRMTVTLTFKETALLLLYSTHL